jgi:alpha-1,3-rhamnosyltransferase
MNTVNPTVSVIIPAYNHDKYVEQAILSIINQTYQDFELLVIDDGSSDSTPQILERLSKQFGFYFERQENMGLPKTLNKLIKMAKGEYIAVCASDDLYPSDRLEKLVSALESDPAMGFVYGKISMIDGHGEPITDLKWFSNFENSENTFDTMIKRGIFFAAGSTLIRKNVYESVGLYNESLPFEDYDWYLRAAHRFPAKSLDDITLIYRKHDQNLSLSKNTRLRMYQGEKKMFWNHRKKPYFYRMLFYRIPVWFKLSIETRQSERWIFPFFTPIYLFKPRMLKNMILKIRFLLCNEFRQLKTKSCGSI